MSNNPNDEITLINRSQTQTNLLITPKSKIIQPETPKYQTDTFSFKNQNIKSISSLLSAFPLHSYKIKKSNTTPISTKTFNPYPNSPSTSEFSLNPPITRTNTSYISNINTIKQKEIPITFEELLLIEEKILNLVSSIKYKKTYIINECVEWWNCFIVSCLYTSTPVKDPEVKILIKNACCLLMYSIMLIYYSMLVKPINTKTNDDVLLDMILYHHRVFLLMCEYLIVNLVNSSNTKDEIAIISRLSKQISIYIKHNNKNEKNVSVIVVNDIEVYCNCLSDTIAKIIKGYGSISTFTIINPNELFSLFYFIKQKTMNDINTFFIEKFLQNKSRIASSFGNNTISSNGTTFSSIKVSIPFLKTKNIKPYTLVLDLDETLIHFHYDPKTDPNMTHGIIQYRPGLFEFLQNVSPYFELIIFTVATKQYADPVINTLERNQKFFSSRLYREHTTIYQNDFVKDLKNLGRDLSKVIIVDDKPFNFSLNKENGIAIRPYWGNESEGINDLALINLIPILFDIIKDKSEDVRIGIKRKKSEIVNKVSSYIYQNKMFN